MKPSGGFLSRICCLTTLAGALVSANSATADILTLEQARELANRQSFSVRQSLADIDENVANVSRAESGFWPSVDAQTTLTPLVAGGELSINQKIYDGGGTLANTRLAKSEKAIAEVELAGTRRSTAIKVIEIYYGAVLAKQRLAYQGYIVDQFRQMSEFFERAFKRGAANKQDSLLSYVAFRRATVTQEKLKVDLEGAILRLMDLIQIRDITPDRLPAEIPHPTLEDLDHAAVQKDILDKSTQLQKLKMSYESLAAQRATSLAKELPHLSAFVSYQWSSDYHSLNAVTNETLFGRPVPQWQAGIKFGLPIFSGFSSVATRQVFAEREKKLDIGLADARSELEWNIQDKLNKLEFSKETIRETERLLGSSEEAWKLLRQEFQLGTIVSATIYSDALDQMNALRATYFKSIADYRIAMESIAVLRN